MSRISSLIVEGFAAPPKPEAFRSLAATGLWLFLFMANESSGAPLLNFDIPAQAAESALIKFAEQANLTLIIPLELVEGKNANPVQGEYEVQEAIGLLLKNTGLRAVVGVSGRLKLDVSETIKENKMKRETVKRAGLFALLASNLAVAPSMSDESDTTAGKSSGIEEVLVTAQRKVDSLQETPVAVSVMTSGDLSLRGIKSITDLMDGEIPTLRISPVGAAVTAHSISVRGITPSDPGQISREQTVGIYLDGVYLGRAQGLGVEQLDLERLEVLRGPQGSLFGRNSLGGAINMVSKKPTGEFGFQQNIGVGNFEYVNSVSRLNLPRFNGLSIKADYQYSKRGGWVSNPAPGQDDWSAFERNGVKLAALWDQMDNFTLEYHFDRSSNDEVTPYMHIGEPLPGVMPLSPTSFQQSELDRVRTARTGSYNEPSTSDVSGHSLTASWKINADNEIKSITAYREIDATQFASESATIVPGPATRFLFGRISLANIRQDQISQEFQLIGEAGRLDYIAGLFYFKEEANDEQASPFGNVLTPDGPALLPEITAIRISRNSFIETESKALFGQLSWTPPVLGDRLELTVGGRYTSDEKIGGRTIPDERQFRFSSDRFDPAVIASLQLNDDVNVYGKWSTAYRGGGVNSRSDTYGTFSEDELTSWEVGLKSISWNNRLRFNVAGYVMDWDDQQLDFVFISPTRGTTTDTVNAVAGSKTKGFELDVTLVPVDGMRIDANYAYMDVDFPPQPNPVGDVVSLKPTQAPENAGSLSLTYDFSPLQIGTLQAYLGVVYTDDYFVSADSLDLAKTGAYTLWNARLTLGDIPVAVGSGEVEVALWGKNLGNEAYRVTSSSNLGGNPVLINHIVSQYNTPRTYGLDISFRF